MSLSYNGTAIQGMTWNGANVQSVTMDGVEVWNSWDDSNTLISLHFDDSLIKNEGTLTQNFFLFNTPTLNTSNKKFGTASMDTSGYNGVECHFPNMPILTGDFTIEMWVYQRGNNKEDPVFLQWSSSQSHTDVYGGISIEPNAIYIGERSWELHYIGDDQLVFNQWRHHAVVRKGNTVTHYINGVAAYSFNYSGKVGNGDPSCLRIGHTTWNNNGSRYIFDGCIDEVRISNVARYNGNFTPKS
jgi:hypothetical protein